MSGESVFSKLFSKITGRTVSDEGTLSSSIHHHGTFDPKKIRRSKRDSTRFIKRCIIEIYSGPNKGTKFELTSNIMYLGNNKNQGKHLWIALNSSHVSPEQAVLKWIYKENKFAIIPDQDIKNQIYIDDIPIEGNKYNILQRDNIIRIDGIELKYNEEFLGEKNAAVINQQAFKYHQPPGSAQEEKIEKKSPVENTLEVDYDKAHMFEIISGPDKERVITISKDMVEEKLIIGKKGAVRKDIELSDNALSDCYASLSFEGDWLFINLEDFSGEILVNNVSIIRKGLEHNDRIQIGNTILQHFLTGNAVTNKYPTLEVLEGITTGKIFELKENLIRIGRKESQKGKEIEIPEDDRSVSRNHAFIEKKGTKYYLSNHKSKNLTLLNGIHVNEARPLVNGDKIKIGNETVFLFHLLEAPILLQGENRITKDLSLYQVDRVVDEMARLQNLPETPDFSEEERLLINSIAYKKLEPSHIEEIQKPDETYITPEKEEKTLFPEKGDVIEPPLVQRARNITSSEIDNDMVHIPGGPFWMGMDHVECDANPLHEVHVEPFLIDRYAVTNLQFGDFIMITGYKSEGNWEEYFTDGKEYYPVVGVTYNDALSYAYWVCKRLPSEAEWEKAGRGENGELYPWGNVWIHNQACCKEMGLASYGEVDIFAKGCSPYGVLNMLGNTWEWTSDHYSPYPYKPLPVQDINCEVVIRGGDWATELKEMGICLRGGIFGDEFLPSVGFRCVRDAGENKI